MDLRVHSWVHFRAPSCRLVHQGLSGFTQVRRCVVRIRVRSLGHAQVSSGSIGFAWFHSDASSGQRVHLGSRGFTRATLGVIAFIKFPLTSLRRDDGASGSCGFASVHSGAPRCRRLHSGSRGFIRARLVVVGFIQVRVGLLGSVTCYSRINLGAPRCRLIHSGSRGFTGAGRRVYSVSPGFARASVSVVGFIEVRVGSMRRT